MRPFFAFSLLLAWPLAEIAGFVVVGRALGLWSTLALVIGTGLLGAFLMRQQGLHLLKKLSQESKQGQIPAGSVVDGAMIVVAGILLLLPGFITDIVGIALFIPFVRRFLWLLIGRRVVVVGSRGRSGYTRPTDPPRESPNASNKVVDLDEEEFHRNSGPNTSSPWSKGIDRDP